MGMQAQVALIDDADGYTNLRERPSVQGAIIAQVPDGYVFFYNHDHIAQEDPWVEVFVAKDPFSLGSMESGDRIGFVHRSRIKLLEEWEKYDGEDFSFRYDISPFDSTQFSIDREAGWISGINGRSPWGVLQALPLHSVEGIDVTYADRQVPVHPAFFQDIYQCHNDFVVYRRGDTFYVHHGSGDGESYYEIVWVFNADGLIQRLVGAPF